MSGRLRRHDHTCGQKLAAEHAKIGHEAAQESNLPSDGLRRPIGFEDLHESGQLQLF
jgi:hypothetical protein